MLRIRDMLLTRDVFPTEEWEQEYEFLVRKRDRYSYKIIKNNIDWLMFEKKSIASKLKYKNEQMSFKKEYVKSLSRY